MLISCSNDRSVKLWKLPDENEDYSEGYFPKFYVNNLHSDYIKCLAYSEKTNSFFSAGFDGKILMMKIDGKTKNTNEIVINEEFYAIGKNNSSIYSIDCDLAGDLLLASAYENVKK